MSITPTIKVQSDDFDAGAELAALNAADGQSGAIASFIGLVRGDEGLAALTLEHYPGMTEKQLRAIADQAAARWPLSAITLIHRHGRLPVGAQIVFVATASAHRRAAFEACEFLMDWLKTKAPFWKQEQWADGSSRWVEAKSSDDDAADRWHIPADGGGNGRA